MKSLITLIALIGFSVFAFHATPRVQTAHKINLSRIESAEIAKKQEDLAKKEKPIIEPVEAPITPPPAPAPVPAPKPVPKPASAPRSSGSCELAYNYDWPARTAAAICMAESSGIATKTNWKDNHKTCVGSYGLMQNACFWFPFFGESLANAHDPVINMRVAYKIYKRQGNFKAWTTYTDGKYLKHL